MISRQEVEYAQDTYEDGSWKVYGTRYTGVYSTLLEDVWFEPSGATRYINAYWRQEVRESGAGGVYFGWGAKAFGVDIGVGLSSTSAFDTKVWIEYVPPDEQVRTLRYRYINGDQSRTGIIGAAWDVTGWA